MVEVVSATQMKLIEKKANELGISDSTLMENAGYSAYKMILSRVGLASRKCLVFCGNGNNGGDGLVFARYAQDAGAEVTVILVGGYPKTKQAMEQMEKVKELNIPVLSADFNQYAITEALGSVDIIIDAVYGLGFHGELKQQDKTLFEKMNSAVAAVFSLDIPSGIQCDSGHCALGCIQADFTIVFDSIKPCHILPQSMPSCGMVDVVDIGIPDGARQQLFGKATILTEAYAKTLLPKRDDKGHKGTFGRVVNIAGSSQYSGAAVLSCKGALSAGAGYVTLISTDEVNKIVACHIPEVLHIQISNKDGCCNLMEITDTTLFYHKATAISIGCGLGTATGLQELLEQLLEEQTIPMVIDADAIGLLSEVPDRVFTSKCAKILTPHPGEMAHLLHCTVDEVENDRYHKTLMLAKKLKAVVVLKGHQTLIANAEGEVYIHTASNSGLAKAGSGDMLTGLIAGILAQGVSAFDAAILGVYVHGTAAQLCRQRLSAYTMQPSDLVVDIGEVFKQLEN